MKGFHKGIRGDTAAFQKAVAVLSRQKDHGPAARLPGCSGPVFLQMVTMSMACQEKQIAEAKEQAEDLVREQLWW